jgi:hypothetical protein
MHAASTVVQAAWYFYGTIQAARTREQSRQTAYHQLVDDPTTKIASCSNPHDALEFTLDCLPVQDGGPAPRPPPLLFPKLHL